MRKSWLGSMALILLVSLILSACGGNSNNEGQSTNDNPSSSASSKPTESATSGPVSLDLFVSGTGLPTANEDFILQKLNKDLNMNLKFNIGAPTDYEQQLNVKIAGGSAPDIFSVSKAQMQNYARQGLLLDLEPHLDKMPNVKAKLSAEDLNKGKVDGKLYAIAKRAYLPMATFWIREDWLQKLELKAPTNLDELLAVATAFTEQDPDGNNKRDTYGITGLGIGSPDAVNAPATFDPVFSVFGIASPGQFLIKDNKVVYSTTQPEMKQAIEYINKMISSGVVDPEIMTNKFPMHQEKAFMGQAGIVYINWGEMVKDNFVEQYKAINPAASWIQVDAITGPAGTYQGHFDIGSTGGRYALPKSLEEDPEKLAKALEYINYITDGEGSLLVMYGEEGVHYTKENGLIVPTAESSKTGYAFNHQLTGRDELNYLKTKFVKQQSFIEFAEKQPRIFTYNEFIPTPEGVSFNDKTRYENEEITKFIYSKRSMDEFDSFVQKIESDFQLDKYMQEADKTLKSLGYIK
jgi:putative aldouronate transport system substrate-binding protein